MNKIDELKSKVCEALDLMEQVWDAYEEPTEMSEEWQNSLENLEAVESNLQLIESILNKELSQDFYDSFTKH